MFEAGGGSRAKAGRRLSRERARLKHAMALAPEAAP
jgi:hypothetical protein